MASQYTALSYFEITSHQASNPYSCAMAASKAYRTNANGKHFSCIIGSLHINAWIVFAV